MAWNPLKRKSEEQMDLEAHQAARTAHEAALEDQQDQRRDLKDQIGRVQKRLELKFAEYKKAGKATKKIVERELRQVKRSLEGLLAKDDVIEQGIKREDASIKQIDRNIAMIEQKMVTVDAGMEHDEIGVVGEEYRDDLLAQDEAVEAMKVEYGVDEKEEATAGDIEDEIAKYIDIAPEAEESGEGEAREEASAAELESETRRLLDRLEED